MSATTLMHPRVAGNYEAKGFYPTDELTLTGLANLIRPSDEAIKFLDPCCGEGEAIATLSQDFPFAEIFAVELDPNRAELAKQRLKPSATVVTGSAFDTHVTPQSIDCLFLNPPYGFSMRDDQAVRRAAEQSKRLEHQFLSQTFTSLKAGGLLIYIIPKTSFDVKTQRWLLTRYDNLAIYEAGTDRFNQLVITGVKRTMPGAVDKKILLTIESLHESDAWPSLPTSVVDEPYRLSSNDKTVKIFAKALTVEGLNEVKSQNNNLWQDFGQFQRNIDLTAIRPLHDLTEWHTCLLITSGVVGGVIDNGLRKLLVKGRTRKIKVIKTVEQDDNALIEEHRDRFETVIKAIDVSEYSQSFGEIIIIK